MVTSTPGILLLPMLICLQHCINVHGKCRVRVRVLCVRVSSVFRCVLGITALGNTHRVRWGLANITERYTCLGCSLKEWPCSATPWASQPCAPTQEGGKKKPQRKRLLRAENETAAALCVFWNVSEERVRLFKLVIDSAGGGFFFLSSISPFLWNEREKGGWRGPCSLCCLLYSICVSLLIHGQLALRSINFTLKTGSPFPNTTPASYAVLMSIHVLIFSFTPTVGFSSAITTPSEAGNLFIYSWSGSRQRESDGREKKRGLQWIDAER